jgi:hypothetical protein
MSFKKILIQVRDELLKEMGTNSISWDINNGNCEEFAIRVLEKFPRAKSAWLDEFPGYEDFAHMILIFKDKFYDAECINGVKSLCDLPLVKNRNKSREQVNCTKATGGNDTILLECYQLL